MVEQTVKRLALSNRTNGTVGDHIALGLTAVVCGKPLCDFCTKQSLWFESPWGHNPFYLSTVRTQLWFESCWPHYFACCNSSSSTRTRFSTLTLKSRSTPCLDRYCHPCGGYFPHLTESRNPAILMVQSMQNGERHDLAVRGRWRGLLATYTPMLAPTPSAVT